MSKLNAIRESTGSKGELPATENFALQVTNYTKDQKGRDAIAGIRLDTGEEATVILRPYKGDTPLKAQRAEVKDFVAKDGEISTLMNNLPTEDMRKQVLKGMKAKTEPGGTILVQRAYVERDTGVVSAGWLQSAAKYPAHCKVLPNVLARVDPVTYREGENKQQLSYSYVTAIHPELSQKAKSLDEFKAAMQAALSGNNVMGGRPLALIRLSDGDSSKAIEFPLPVKVDKKSKEVTVFTPDAAVAAFLASDQGKIIADLAGDPDINIEVVPGSKVSIGSQAKAGYTNSAAGLEQVNSAYRFKKSEQGETGFTPSYLVLHDVGEDGVVFSCAQPLSNKPPLYNPRDIPTAHYQGKPSVVNENKEAPAHVETASESKPEEAGEDFDINDVVAGHMPEDTPAPRMRM